MNNIDKVTLTIPKEKNIALIAHDGKKPDIIKWCEEHKEVLAKHKLYGTGTTARLITEKTGLTVEGKIDFVIFFTDPLTAQPHDPDVKALLRIVQVYDVPMAINKSSADFIITSSLMDEEYDHDVINFKENVSKRVKEMS